MDEEAEKLANQRAAENAQAAEAAEAAAKEEAAARRDRRAASPTHQPATPPQGIVRGAGAAALKPRNEREKRGRSVSVDARAEVIPIPERRTLNGEDEELGDSDESDTLLAERAEEHPNEGETPPLRPEQLFHEEHTDDRDT